MPPPGLAAASPVGSLPSSLSAPVAMLSAPPAPVTSATTQALLAQQLHLQQQQQQLQLQQLQLQQQLQQHQQQHQQHSLHTRRRSNPQLVLPQPQHLPLHQLQLQQHQIQSQLHHQLSISLPATTAPMPPAPLVMPMPSSPASAAPPPLLPPATAASITAASFAAAAASSLPGSASSAFVPPSSSPSARQLFGPSSAAGSPASGAPAAAGSPASGSRHHGGGHRRRGGSNASSSAAIADGSADMFRQPLPRLHTSGIAAGIAAAGGPAAVAASNPAGPLSAGLRSPHPRDDSHHHGHSHSHSHGGGGGGSSLSKSHQKNPSLYKTELCRTWEETGSCKYGSKCQFAHSAAELRVVERHPKYKTEMCKTFWEKGTCPYGKRCCFIHLESEAREPPLSSSSKERRLPAAIRTSAAASAANGSGSAASPATSIPSARPRNFSSSDAFDPSVPMRSPIDPATYLFSSSIPKSAGPLSAAASTPTHSSVFFPSLRRMSSFEKSLLPRVAEMPTSPVAASAAAAGSSSLSSSVASSASSLDDTLGVFDFGPLEASLPLSVPMSASGSHHQRMGSMHHQRIPARDGRSSSFSSTSVWAPSSASASASAAATAASGPASPTAAAFGSLPRSSSRRGFAKQTPVAAVQQQDFVASALAAALDPVSVGSAHQHATAFLNGGGGIGANGHANGQGPFKMVSPPSSPQVLFPPKSVWGPVAGFSPAAAALASASAASTASAAASSAAAASAAAPAVMRF
ncbi:hypothetical protein HK105_200461 [Polyrhizophydium stewartii]|uniref:C3H1-type domain-containing protein n=1 Tax=Polyrhizophydium stewartii TaxID=2732419 RepID=A0ABR4NLG5_9FUNG